MRRKWAAILVLSAGFLAVPARLPGEEGASTPWITDAALQNGDLNGDWEIDLSDAIYLIGYLFTGGPPPVPLACEADRPDLKNGDTNGDGARDLADGIRLLAWLYASGAPPARACDPGPGGGASSRSVVRWAPCFSDFGPFECGTLYVPLDYGVEDDPGNPAIAIALVRLPAADPAHRIGSLIFNPGGPGGSGVDFVVFAGPLLYSEEVRARFDLVGFDPRGVARSTALHCFHDPSQFYLAFTPFAFPVTPEEEAEWAAADRRLADACEHRGKRIIDHMATADVARDLDRLRQALGDDRINYVGYSYGSYLGITYASLFPRRIRTLVVDGVIDPIAWATGAAGESATAPVTQRIGSAAGGQATLGEFFRLCDAGGPNCAFAGDSAARFAALAALLRSGPIQMTDPTTGATSPFTYADLIINAFGSMYSSSSWPALADLLAFIEAQASPAELGFQLQALREEAGLKKKGEFPAYANAPEWFPAVMCTDSDNPDSFAAWSRAAAESETQVGYFGPPWIWFSSVCAVWPGRDADRYTGPFNRATANPVLVVGNQFDNATRYAGAVKVNGLLPGSSLLTVHGWGHTSMFLSSCADAIVSRYLLEMATPPPGTVCEQDVVPFAEGPASLQTGEGAAARRQARAGLIPEGILRAAR